MKIAKFTILLIVTVALMNWMRGDYNYALPTVLPFLHGEEPSLVYDLGGVMIVAIVLVGLRRLSRQRRDRN
jgi:hypothetical protein